MIQVALAHVCLGDLSTLAGQVKDLLIPVMFGGHCIGDSRSLTGSSRKTRRPRRRLTARLMPGREELLTGKA